jgi:polyhydroxybutyrate depolymerase
MTTPLGSLATALVALLLCGPALARDNVSVDIDGRRYVAVLPDDPRNAPIVLALHGGGGHPEQFDRSSGFSQAAADAGYLVVLPEGSGYSIFKTWNTGHCCGYAQRAGVDDVAFLDDVVEDAAARFGANPNRVYATGLSNGSMMAELYGNQRAGRVRAVAGVAGTPDPSTLTGDGAVPVLHVHGDADTHVPIEGGVGEDSFAKVDYPPLDIPLGILRDAFGPMETSTRQGDGYSVQDWTQNNTPMVRLVVVEGGGHAWFGGARSVRQGGANTAVSANQLVLEFFALHP